MKLALAASLIILFSGICWTQETVVEPEFADVFFSLDSGKLIPLERQSASTQIKTSGFLVVNGKGVMAFPGKASPVRFHGGELVFIVRSQSAASGIDPTDLYHLRRLSVQKDQREILLTTVHVSRVGGSATSTRTDGIIPLAFSRYGGSSYKVTASALAPGEYAIGRARGQTVFCFGID
jgi:hypothetical protein